MSALNPTAPSAATLSEVDLIEKAAVRVGMKSLMNHGAASCVYSEGCNGVSQAHLIAFAREVALHCIAALATPPTAAPVDAKYCWRVGDKWYTNTMPPKNPTDGTEWVWVAASAAPVQQTVEVLEYVERMLTNLQPHISQACYPGRSAFIDNYVDPVLERVRAALKGEQHAAMLPDITDDTPLETGEGDAR